MTHGRHPRRPRPVRAMAFYAARNNATRLTDAERAETLATAQQCLDHLRTGTATEDHHTVLHTHLQIAHGIEASGIVRGLHAALLAADDAMASIRARALASGKWRAPTLYASELAALREALHWHDYQLQQLSAGELHAITKKLMARTLSTGGAVERRSLAELGLCAGADA